MTGQVREGHQEPEREKGKEEERQNVTKQYLKDNSQGFPQVTIDIKPQIQETQNTSILIEQKESNIAF